MPNLPVHERQQRILDAAAELFYERGVHEVGMDELIRATGLGKATVYRLYPSKDALIAAYLHRHAERILALIDADIERHTGDPTRALDALFAAIETDVRRDGFRGCAFNNASIEFADPAHPAREQARAYREALLERLRTLCCHLRPGNSGPTLADALALIIDGMYTNAAHLGPSGPASHGRTLARQLIRNTP